MAFFWKKKENEKITLSDIMRGMQYSVNTAQEILERHHIKILNKYFTSKGLPITKTVQINEKQSIEVPLVAIINQSSLGIDELELEFSASIDTVDLKKLESDGNEILLGAGQYPEEIERTSFGVGFQATGKKENQVSVKIKFKTTKPPEGVCRIIDEFDKLIQPSNNQES